MDSPETKNSANVSINDDEIIEESSGRREDVLLSSSLPNTRNSPNFLTDSSERSNEDDESIEIGDERDDEGEEGEYSGYYYNNKNKMNKNSKAKPLIFSSSASTASSGSTSPTAVYATMLNANNIVNNSISVLLQAGTRLPNPPTLIEYAELKFLIMDAPSQSNLHLYLKEMERVRVRDVVRICEPTYSKEMVESSGIKVHDWVFPDGESPPNHVIESWLSLVDKTKSNNLNNRDNPDDSSAIAVHCVAGLGRAPVLVAIALIENGMKPLDAVMFIRQRRRGAINNKQLKFLENYRPRRLKNDKCIIM